MRREFSETRISLKFPAALATNWTRCPGFSLPCNPTWSSVSSQIVIFPLLPFLPNTAAIRGYKHNTSDISVRSTQHLFLSTFLRPSNREIVDLAIARREKILKNRGFVQSSGFFFNILRSKNRTTSTQESNFPGRFPRRRARHGGLKGDTLRACTSARVPLSSLCRRSGRDERDF